ncbi:MAG TPA: CapA family protein [Mucilaginibacter sp.]|nr:CapA family protein [Mucilaginibacter sp.]
MTNVVQQPPYHILLLGDTSFGENYQQQIARYGGLNILESKGYDHCMEKVAPLLSGADLVIANLETPVTDILRSPYEGIKKYLHYADPVKTPEALLKYGIHAVSLANNHLPDYGPEGLRQTLRCLKEHGIRHFGAGINAEAAAGYLSAGPGDGREIIIATGYEYRRSYGIFGYRFYAEGDHPGINKWSKGRAPEQMKAIRSNHPDAYIIAYPHWGENYKWKNERQTELAHLLIDAGADLVIGHGAHALQEIGGYKGKPIIYSLGNFVFNSPGRYNNGNQINSSLIARLIFSADEKNPDIKLYPIVSDNMVTGYQPRPLESVEMKNLEEKLSSCNGLLSAVSAKDSYGYYFQLG